MLQIVNKNIQDINQWVIYFSSESYQEWFATVGKMWAESLGKAQWDPGTESPGFCTGYGLTSS